MARMPPKAQENQTGWGRRKLYREAKKENTPPQMTLAVSNLSVCLRGEASRRAGCGKSARPVSERGWENSGCRRLSAKLPRPHP